METKQVVANKWQSIVWNDPHRYIVLACGRRAGKALALGTPILTTKGFRAMGDLKVGDFVFNEKGKQTQIISTSQVFKDHDCYELTFSSGEKMVADAGHRWLVEDKSYRKNIVRTPHTSKAPRILTTEQMSKNFKILRVDGEVEYNYAIRKADPLTFSQTRSTKLLHPYLLGLWLGDGTSSNPNITITEKEILDLLLSFGYIANKSGSKSSYCIFKKDQFQKGMKRQRTNSSIKKDLVELSLLNRKHIPKKYLYASLEERRLLLKGLMDTDGTIDVKGRCEFSVIDKILAKDVLFLIRSLGMKANMRECDAKLYGRLISKRYRICFTPNFNCFFLAYKSSRLKSIRKTDTSRHFITDIKKVASVPTRCITVDSPSHLFLAGRSLIPTHNSFLSALKIADFLQSYKTEEIVNGKKITKPAPIVYYVSPTYAQSKAIMWNMLKEYLPAHWISKFNEAELKVELINGARIELKGADTEPDRLRGVRIDYLICDEVAYFKNWDTVWHKVLLPTLVDSQGKALFISSPQGYNHFYSMYMRGQTNTVEANKDWVSYRFTTYDNEYIKSEEIDKIRQEMDEDTFAQEHLAEFKKYTGLVLKYFSRERHYVSPIEFPQNTTFYRGIDFGWTNPSAVVFLAVTPDSKCYVYDLIYQAGLTASELASLIKQKSIGIHFTATWADSAQQADIEQLRKFGITVNPVSKSASKGLKGEDFTTYKVRKFNELIKSNKFFVFNHLTSFLHEIENWQYKEVREGDRIREIPAKLNDHAIDAASYIIINLPQYFEPSLVSDEQEVEMPDWAEKAPSWSSLRVPKWFHS